MTAELPIESLRNLGPKSGQWLREAGINTIAELERLGPVVAFRLVKQRQPKAISKVKVLVVVRHQYPKCRPYLHFAILNPSLPLQRLGLHEQLRWCRLEVPEQSGA